MIDVNLLIEILSIQSKSDILADNKNIAGKDKAMRDYIKYFGFNRLKGEIKIEEDGYGNIYITKGKGPVYIGIVSHVDTVHEIVQDYKVIRNDDYLFAFNGPKMTGIGGDDKVGIFIALMVLSDFDNVRAVFYRNEEIGCKGSNHSDVNFLNKCCFVIQCDRNGNSDFIDYTNGLRIASTEFVKAVEELESFKKFNFKVTTGTSTDVGKLKDIGLKVSACNISCGYYNAHKPEEYVSIKDVGTTYTLVTEMINKLGNKVWTHVKYVPPVTKELDFNYGVKYMKDTPYFKAGYKEGIEDTINNIKPKIASKLWSVIKDYLGYSYQDLIKEIKEDKSLNKKDKKNLLKDLEFVSPESVKINEDDAILFANDEEFEDDLNSNIYKALASEFHSCSLESCWGRLKASDSGSYICRDHGTVFSIDEVLSVNNKK